MKNLILDTLKTKHFKDNISGFDFLTENSSLHEIERYLSHVRDLHLDESIDLLKDLLDIKQGVQKTEFYSDVCEEYFEQLDTWSNMVKIRLQQSSDVAQEIIELLKLNSDESYIVGGFVRDAIMIQSSKDIDFVTDIEYETLVELFKYHNFSVKEVGKEYLVIVVSKDRESYEISNFRKDGVYLDGRRPESVEIGDILSDATRRDFTINAIYFNLKTEFINMPLSVSYGDTQERILRFVGKPIERIKEDTLRVFRFYRFLSKGFIPDKKSLKVVRGYFDVAITSTTPERIRLEIERMIDVHWE